MTAAPVETVRLGDFEVHRPGFGALHLAGPQSWGPPTDRESAIAVAREAVALGMDFIDTADSYGVGASEELLAEALAPYDEKLLIATKAGMSRPSPEEWVPLGRPEYLRQQAELSLMRLRVDRLDLFSLHRIDPQVPADEQFDALRQLQDAGKIRHIGLSEVTVAEIEQAQQHFEVASVQNRYNLADREHEAVLDHCTAQQIAFVPWNPLDSDELARPGGHLHRIADEHGASTSQVALAWLMRRSAMMLPIPGTSSVEHLAENFASARIELTDDQYADLDSASLEFNAQADRSEAD